MTRTYGIYEVTLDSKGRILFPSNLKKKLPDEESSTFMLAEGDGTHLVLYTLSQWKKIEETIDTLNDYNDEARELKRSMLGEVADIDLDAAGRLPISKRLQLKAGLGKDLILQGISDKILIWDAGTFANRETMDNERRKMLMSKLLGANPLNPIKGS